MAAPLQNPACRRRQSRRARREAQSGPSRGAVGTAAGACAPAGSWVSCKTVLLVKAAAPGCAASGLSLGPRSRCLCSTLKTVGTKNSVATVANSSPPITARPSGAFCSPPSPEAERHRHHADDHGERRHQHRPESREAGIERGARRRRRPASSRSRAKLTTRMLLAVATPMHMIAPVSAGTDSVVPVMNSIQTMPASAAGQRGDDDERIEPGLEIDHDQQIDQHDRAGEPDIELAIGARHRGDLPASNDMEPRGRSLWVSFRMRGCPSATDPRSRPWTAP